MAIEPEQLEEAAVAGRELGRLVKTQYDGCVEAGFSPAQALYLAGVWMRQAISNGGSDEAP